jgi:hypothetical protein
MEVKINNTKWRKNDWCSNEFRLWQ